MLAPNCYGALETGDWQREGPVLELIGPMGAQCMQPGAGRGGLHTHRPERAVSCAAELPSSRGLA